MDVDFFFKPRLNRNIDDMIDKLLGALDILSIESTRKVSNGCLGLRMINGKTTLCSEETVAKFHCPLHVDIAARVNILYHNVDLNFQKLLDIIDNKVKKTSTWSKELTQFTGLLTNDKNYMVPNEDIDLVLLDWNFVFDIVDNIEITDYLETIDDVVYAFLVADLIYKLRCLSQIVLFSEVGIDPGHLRYLILTLHMRNKISKIIGQDSLRLNLSTDSKSIKTLIKDIESTKNACVYVYNTLELFTTINRLQIDRRYNPFYLIDSESFYNRERVLLPIARFISSNVLPIYSTQEPRNNCSNVISIKQINRILADSKINIEEENFLRRLCNAVLYESLYDAFNCLVLRINSETKSNIQLLVRTMVLPRPRLMPKVALAEEYHLTPYSKLARHSPVRTSLRIENTRKRK